MKLVQFAVPEKVGDIVAEAATVIAGGATLLPALGWWVNGKGEVERERVNWLIVGVEESKVSELVNAVKSILKSVGEAAIFYVAGGEAKLEWL